MKRRTILLTAVLSAFPAAAQAQTGSCNPATIFKNLKPTTFITALQTCAANDIAAVIADANMPPVDNLALSCIQPLQAIASAAKQDGGLLLAFQKFRRAKQSGFVPACTAWVNSVVMQ